MAALLVRGLLWLLVLGAAPPLARGEACRCESQSFAWQGCSRDAAGCDDAGWLGCADASPDDDFRIGPGCQVTVAPGDDILLEQSAGARLSVAAGGSLSVEGPVELRIGPGGLAGEAGSTVALRGCFREFAAAPAGCTAELGATHLFQIGDVVPCRDGDCSGDAAIVRIRYSDAQVQASPFLAPFLASLDAARDVLCFWQTSEDADVGADSGYCYDIIEVSAAPGDRHLDFDIRQGWAAPSDQAGYPLARRQVQQATLAGAHPAGSRTLHFQQLGLVTHRTDQMGRWVRCAGDQRAYLIATVGDLAGGDTLTLADWRGLERSYPSATRCHVDWGWGAGDAAFVMAPVHLNSRTHTTGESFAKLEGQVAMRALVVDGLGQGAPYGNTVRGALMLQGAQIQELRHVWVVDPLVADEAAVALNDVACGAAIEHLIITGGPPLAANDKNYGLAWTGGADCGYSLRHLYVRFMADDNFVTDSSGLAPTDRIDWRWIHAGPSSGRGDSGQLFDFGGGNRVDAFGADALCTACTTQDGFGTLVTPSGFGLGELARILWVGVFNGSFSLLEYPGYRFSEIGIVGSAIDTANWSGAGALVAPNMEDFYVLDVHDPRSNPMNLCGNYAGGPGTGTLRRGIFADLSLGALPCRLAGADALEDVYFLDVGRSGPAGSLVEVAADATDVALHRVTMAFRAAPSGVSEGVGVDPAGAAGLSLDGLLLSGFRGPQLASAMALGSVEAAAAVLWGAPVCFWDNDRDEDEAVLAAYGTPPLRDTDPGFVDPERLRFDVAPGGVADQVGCAARAAGVPRTNWAHRKAKLEPLYMGEPPLVYECSDGIDNDGDGLSDHLLDTGCSSPSDWLEAVDFSGGGVFEINAATSIPSDSAVVWDGPEMIPTELRIAAGASVGRNLSAQDRSIAVIAGGFVQGDAIALDDGRIEVRSGEILGSLRGEQMSSIEVEAGVIATDLVLSDSATAEVRGGAIGGLLRATDSTIVDVYGGVLVQGVEARDDSLVRLFGGSLMGGLVLRESAAIEVHGHAFDREPGIVADHAGTITGQLEDGTPIAATFLRTDGTRLELVPEPVALLQAMAALAALAARSRACRCT